MSQQSVVKMQWMHSIERAIDKLEANWRTGSGTVEELKEIKAYLWEQWQGQKVRAKFEQECG